MNSSTRRSITAALAVPTAFLMAWAPTAPAATVLAVEGAGQPLGATQTALSGAFCAQNTCRSIDNDRGPFDVVTGSEQIQAAVESTQGEIIVMAYSLGAASTYNRMRAWETDSAQAPDPDRLKLIVTLGNPENRFGGADRKNAYAGLPAVQPFEHLDVAMQYDSVADRPTRKGFLSKFNTSIAQHVGYFRPIDVNDPDNLIYRDADGTTYMLIKADVLPMLRWVDGIISDKLIAQLDAKLRPLIERDYDRPAYVPQGEGADWGNGIAPPTVQDVSDDVDASDVDEARRPQESDAEDEPDAENVSVDLAGDTPGTDGSVDKADAATDADAADSADGGQADDDEAVSATDSASQTSAAGATDDGS